ncbi:EpsG family protein [Fusobacterium massiliense]|uniref:EpsG family protein n=1 Tax=Fusobacterium massiliense TaxID=1852365 RepID=UPI0028ED3789|nr:EpsG family protein [Fusobacterium massiliense]
MLIYYLFPFVLYICSLFNFKNRKFKVFLVISLGVFLCTTYFNGSDWRQYEIMYNEATLAGIQDFEKEKGFYLYMLLFKLFNIDFFNFFIITKSLLFYIFYRIILEKSKNFYIVFNLFYTLMGLFLFIDAPLRNLITITFVVYAQKYLEEKSKIKYKNIKYTIFILMAFSFHKTAIIFLLLLFTKKIYKLKSINIVIMLFVFYILFLDQEILIKLIVPFFKDRIANYIGTVYSKHKLFSYGNLEKIFIITLIIFNRKKLTRNDNGKIIFINTILYFIFYRIALTFSILYRLILYLQIYYILSIDFLVDRLKFNFKVIILTLFFCYQCLIIYKEIYKTYKYIPYSSYISYIFQDKPSYNFRSRYNYEKWEKRFNTKYNAQEELNN